ncbi:MAG: cell wall-binding repeat-containing protein [Lachnospiraceae bacterium]|nr:cell wall-binding repeat-containing protein [Lachnospiraceae bacterium]
MKGKKRLISLFLVLCLMLTCLQVPIFADETEVPPAENMPAENLISEDPLTEDPSAGDLMTEDPLTEDPSTNDLMTEEPPADNPPVVTDPPAHGPYEGTSVTSEVYVTGTADFYINDSAMSNVFGGNNAKVNVNYNYNNGGTVDFYFDCFVNARYSSLTINNVDYLSAFPTPDTAEGRAAILAACRGQLNDFKITVPYSTTYTIQSTVKELDESDIDYMMVGNFLWSYTDEDINEDDRIENGRMELVNVVYDGTTYTPDQMKNPGTGFDWDDRGPICSAVLPIGAVVTVKMIPEYGYQLTSFGINDKTFTIGEEQTVYSFTIRRGNAHLAAKFTPVEDVIVTNEDIISDADIAVADDFPGGTVKFEVNPASNLSPKYESFQANVPDGYKIMNFYDLDLSNVYYKANESGDNAWENEMTELTSDATITLKFRDQMWYTTSKPEDFVVIHNIHGGDEFETIPLETVDQQAGISFKTDSFSTFAIAVKEKYAYEDESEDTSIIYTHWFFDLYGKQSGSTGSMRISQGWNRGATFYNFDQKVEESIALGQTQLNLFLDSYKSSHPQIGFEAAGDCVIEKTGVKSYDNRTYAMISNGDGTRHCKITGTYGREGTYTIRKPVSYTNSPLQVKRLGGSDRYATAAAIAREAFAGETVEEVVIVTGRNFPDALSAGGYAGFYDCPVLLSNESKINPTTKELLKSYGNLKRITIIGKTFQEGFYKELEATTGLKRTAYDRSRNGIFIIGGNDRYETSLEVYKALLKDSNFKPRYGLVTTGKNPADALSASAASYRNGFPIILARKSGLSAEARQLIEKNNLSLVILGSEENCNDDLLEKYKNNRVAGNDRYETSALFARFAANKFGYKDRYTNIAFAAGANANYPDALVGGMLIGRKGGQIVLVRGQNAPNNKDAFQYISDNLGNYLLAGQNIYILGSDAAVSKATSDTLARKFK